MQHTGVLVVATRGVEGFHFHPAPSTRSDRTVAVASTSAAGSKAPSQKTTLQKAKPDARKKLFKYGFVDPHASTSSLHAPGSSGLTTFQRRTNQGIDDSDPAPLSTASLVSPRKRLRKLREDGSYDISPILLSTRPSGLPTGSPDLPLLHSAIGAETSDNDLREHDHQSNAALGDSSLEISGARHSWQHVSDKDWRSLAVASQTPPSNAFNQQLQRQLSAATSTGQILAILQEPRPVMSAADDLSHSNSQAYLLQPDNLHTGTTSLPHQHVPSPPTNSLPSMSSSSSIYSFAHPSENPSSSAISNFGSRHESSRSKGSSRNTTMTGSANRESNGNGGISAVCRVMDPTSAVVAVLAVANHCRDDDARSRHVEVHDAVNRLLSLLRSHPVPLPLHPIHHCQLTWSLARLHRPDPALLAPCLEALRPNLVLLPPDLLFRCVWGCASLGHQPGERWLEEFCRVTQSVMPSFHPGRLVLVAWSLARLRHSPGQAWVDALTARLRPALKRLSNQNCANLAWALPVLRARPNEAWLDDFVSACQLHLRSMTALGLSQTMYGLALMTHRPPPAWTREAFTMMQRWLPGLQPLQDCHVLWAAAVWGACPSDQFMAEFTAASLARLPLYNANDLAMAAWSLSHLQYLPAESWFDAFFKLSAAQFAASRPANLVSLATALLRWGLRPPPSWMTGLLEAFKAALPHCSSKNIANFMYAMSAMRQSCPPRWLLHVVTSFSRHVSGGSARVEDVVTVLYALHRCCPAPTAKLLAKMAGPLQLILACEGRRLITYTPQQLMLLVLALARFKFAPGTKFLHLHVSVASKRVAELAPSQKQHLTAAYKLLATLPPPTEPPPAGSLALGAAARGADGGSGAYQPATFVTSTT